MDEAKKQLSSALLQSKASVLSWWVKQTTTSAKLPIPPSPVRSPAGEVDAATSTATVTPSPKISTSTSPSHDFPIPSRERDEYDLIEVRLVF